MKTVYVATLTLQQLLSVCLYVCVYMSSAHMHVHTGLPSLKSVNMHIPSHRHTCAHTFTVPKMAERSEVPDSRFSLLENGTFVLQMKVWALIPV